MTIGSTGAGGRAVSESQRWLAAVEVRVMDPARVYRESVVPLAIFFLLGGMIMAALVWVARLPIISPFPFIESETLNRHLFGITSLACVGIGFGLLFRNRVAWYALLVYLGIGVLVPAISALDGKVVASRGFEFPIIGSLLNGFFGVGLYFVLRPAFLDRKGQRGPNKARVGGEIDGF